MLLNPNPNKSRTMKKAYLLPLTTDPVTYQFGEYHGHVNACEIWEELSEGDVIEIVTFDDETVIGHAEIVKPVRANILAVRYKPETVTDLGILRQIAGIELEAARIARRKRIPAIATAQPAKPYLN